jgi:serine/threonine-protein kinase
VLVLGVVISTWQATRANRETRRAVAAEEEATARAAAERDAREESEAISKFMTEVFQSPNPNKDGREIKVVELLDKAATRMALI